MPHQHKKTANDKKDKGNKPGGYRSPKPPEILKTDKATNTTNPLHESLSEKPAKENKAVRESEEDAADT